MFFYAFVVFFGFIFLTLALILLFLFVFFALAVGGIIWPSILILNN